MSAIYWARLDHLYFGGSLAAGRLKDFWKD
jgi:hypothetical protein